MHFDPHINEPGLYKPRFFQVRHHKSSSLGEALSVWIAFFSARSLVLFSNCSFQNKVFTCWFLNCSFKNKSVFYCCNCSSWNNIVRVCFQLFFSEQLCWFSFSQRYRVPFFCLRCSDSFQVRFSSFVISTTLPLNCS